MVYVSCSDRPFRNQDEEDISRIMVFLDRLEEDLKPISRQKG